MDNARHRSRKGVHRPQQRPSILFDPTKRYLHPIPRDIAGDYLDWRQPQPQPVRHSQIFVPQYQAQHQVRNTPYSQVVASSSRRPLVYSTPIRQMTQPYRETHLDLPLSNTRIPQVVTPRAILSNAYLQEITPRPTVSVETKLLAFLANHLHQHTPTLVLLTNRTFRTFGSTPTILYAKDHEISSPEIQRSNLANILYAYSKDENPLFIDSFRTEILTFREYNDESRETRHRLEARISCLSNESGLLSIKCQPIVLEKTFPAGPKSEVEEMSFEDVLEELKRASFVMFDVLGQKRVAYERVRIERNVKGKEKKAGKVRPVEWDIIA